METSTETRPTPEPDATEPLLRMRGIVKHFPGVRALDGIDIEVRAGDVHCLLGQNGAGKSTLIKAGEMEATVLYSPTQAADGIRLARLLAQGKGLSDLVQVEVPRRIVLNAPVVTKENVDKYLPLGFES